jgi:uncharacterized protein YfiM (DUF2279 family)
MFGATFYMPRAQMQHDGSAGHAVSQTGGVLTDRSHDGTANLVHSDGVGRYAFDSRSAQDLYAVPQVAVTQDLSGSWYTCCAWCWCNSY